MKRLSWLSLILSIALLLLGMAISILSASNDTPTREQLEQTIEELYTRIVATEKEVTGLLKQIEKEEASITQLKRQQTRGRSRTLIRALRAAQARAVRVESLQRNIDQDREHFAQLWGQLRHVYGAQLRRLLSQLEQATSDTQRKTPTAQLLEALGRWDRLRQKYRDVVSVVPDGTPDLTHVGKLRIEREDTPSRILAKADLARDRADWLRARAYQTAARVQRARAEQELRSKLAVFAEDIAMFSMQLPVPETRPVPEAKTVERRGEMALDAVSLMGDEPPAPAPEQPILNLQWPMLPEIEGLDLAEQIGRLQRYRDELERTASAYDRLACQLQQQAQKLLNAENHEPREPDR